MNLSFVFKTIFILFAVSFSAQEGAFAAEMGSFQTQFVGNDFILSSSEGMTEPSTSSALIESYIQSKFPSRDTYYKKRMTTTDLAKRIAGAAYCFHIDPFVFASLIRKESVNFSQYARSPTGAVGFTQFTTIATREVSDQLGMRGGSAAREDASDYFNSVLTGDCLETFGNFTGMGSQYVPMWEMGFAKKYAKNSYQQTYVMTRRLASLPEYSIIYGAILLKDLLSSVERGDRTGCKHYRAGHVLTLKEKYNEAIMAYNGDHCSVELTYERDVLNNFYPAITGVESN